ncbi:MAG: hypothetical protein IPL83_08245 [Bdellovibrionales bacterium]|nr:hypothetical protein [Bdellovibrionales bacterium]
MTTRFDKIVRITAKLGRRTPLDFQANKGKFQSLCDKKGKVKQALENYFSGNNELNIGFFEFNQIMHLLGQAPVSKWFFETLFGDSIQSLKFYKEKVNEFNIKSALRFGNFKYAFRFFVKA